MIKAATYWLALFVWDDGNTLTLSRGWFNTHEKCLAHIQSYDWREKMETTFKHDLSKLGNLVSVGCHRNDVNTANIKRELTP
jgi:hypothetical protein